jgi:dTDP-4-dehydrorhamnose 3,5-epimerase
VIGEGHNFVRTMQRLAADGVSPTVVHDQVGRLTFTPSLSAATKHLIDSGSPYGIYNVQGSGLVTSWADLAKEVFRLSGRDADDVTPVTTEEYVAGREGISPRPASGVLDLSKIEGTGFTPGDQLEQLRAYCSGESVRP